MSTYTNFHNIIKETINVISNPHQKNDRETQQCVRLLNPKNEFCGKIISSDSSELTNVTIEKGTFNEISSINETLVDPNIIVDDAVVQLSSNVNWNSAYEKIVQLSVIMCSADIPDSQTVQQSDLSSICLVLKNIQQIFSLSANSNE